MTLARPFARLASACVLAFAGAHASAAQPAHLSVHVAGLSADHTIPTRDAVCVPKAKGHMGFGPDINPAISWSRGPRGTLSYAVLIEDWDSPGAHRDWMNRPDRQLTAGVLRKTFFHEVLVDIPPDVTSIAQGEVSHGLVPHGKPPSASPVGVPGLNDYVGVFAGNPAMTGRYFGYDGPCPPWNDQVVHEYHFIVYALNVARLDLEPGFDGPEALAAMHGKVIARGEEIGRYTTNPAQGARAAAAR